MFNTKEELAARLNRRQYGEEIFPDEEKRAKELGLVVVFGYSDDAAEFRGAIHDEVYVPINGEILIDAKGQIPVWEKVRDELDEDEAKDYFVRKPKAVTVTAKEKSCVCFVFSTALPHATFEIDEDGDTYCRGIVFQLPAQS